MHIEHYITYILKNQKNKTRTTKIPNAKGHIENEI